MAKWADYLISAVRYVKTDTSRHISKLKVHVCKGGSVGAARIWTRKKVISAIANGKTFKTIYKGRDGKWKKGQVVVEIRNCYIKTVPNSMARDNLEVLPRF